MKSEICEEEWLLVKSLLPEELDASARRSGALCRARGVGDGETLLRLLLLHVAGGLSLAQAALRARNLGLADISHVALFKRLRGAQPWLEELCAAMIAGNRSAQRAHWPLTGRKFRVLDASDIREPGATGSSWKLHYSITLPDLRCDFAQFTDCKGAESLQRLPVNPGDIVLADRAYGKRQQIAWLLEQGADAVVRLHPPSFPIGREANEEEDSSDLLPEDWLEKLRTLAPLTPGEWTVRFEHKGHRHTVRACALRKSATATAQARHKIEIEARKKHRNLRPETLEMASYVVVLCTLGPDELDTAGVLELYRCRWQVELAFKRLKSLLEMSAVPKSDPQGARAWMQAKLLEALLVERLLEESSALSPWGYRLPATLPVATLH